MLRGVIIVDVNTVLVHFVSLLGSDCTMIFNAVIPLLLILQCSWSLPVDQFYPFGRGGDGKFSSKSRQSLKRVKLSNDARTYSRVFVSLNLVYMCLMKF